MAGLRHDSDAPALLGHLGPSLALWPLPFCVPRGQTTSCRDGLLELEADPLHPTVTRTDQAASITA